VNRGDLVTLWGGTAWYRLTSRGADGYWACERVNDPTNVQHAKESAMTLVPAKARHTDPDTSHEAAERASAHAEGDRRRVLALLAEHGPLTDFDLARLTGRKQTSVGVRRGELRDAGLVEQHDRSGVSDTGSPCIRWTLTSAGRQAAA